MHADARERAGKELAAADRGEREAAPSPSTPARIPAWSGQDLDVPVSSVHANPLPVPDQLGGLLHPHDGR